MIFIIFNYAFLSQIILHIIIFNKYFQFRLIDVSITLFLIPKPIIQFHCDVHQTFWLELPNFSNMIRLHHTSSMEFQLVESDQMVEVLGYYALSVSFYYHNQTINRIIVPWVH